MRKNNVVLRFAFYDLFNPLSSKRTLLVCIWATLRRKKLRYLATPSNIASRSGPTEINLIGTPTNSSMRSR